MKNRADEPDASDAQLNPKPSFLCSALKNARAARLAWGSQVRRGMRDIEPVIEALLAQRPTGFRNKHLAEALGVSHTRACQLLASRVLSGELQRTEGPRSQYIRGPDRGEADGSLARGARAWGFWKVLVDAYPKLVYVSLRAVGLIEVRTRRQIRGALRGAMDYRRFLIVDFEGVRFISDAASRELFITLARRWGMLVEAINLDSRVAQSVGHVRFGD
jgi:hypothetical protein